MESKQFIKTKYYEHEDPETRLMRKGKSKGEFWTYKQENSTLKETTSFLFGVALAGMAIFFLFM